MKEAFNDIREFLPSIKEILGSVILISGFLFGKEKWLKEQEKKRVRKIEVDTNSVSIDNEIKLINVLKKEIKDLNDKIDIFEKKQDELYKKITKLQDDNLILHQKLIECLKAK